MPGPRLKKTPTKRTHFPCGRPALQAIMALLAMGLMTTASGNSASASNADFFLGSWVIVKAVVAPWADAARKPDEREMKSLLGKVVTFEPKQIAGPAPVACHELNYQLNDYGADMLFQGALAEKPDGTFTDASKLAASLGFQGDSWKTLETGCGNELDYHFLDRNTADFGLNDYVYTLKRK